MKFTEALEMLNENKTLKFEVPDSSYGIKWEKGTLKFYSNSDRNTLDLISSVDFVVDWHKVEPPKLKYKFWEVVKMLTEDNSKEFRKSNYNALTVRIADNMITFYRHGTVCIGQRISDIEFNCDWEEC